MGEIIPKENNPEPEIITNRGNPTDFTALLQNALSSLTNRLSLSDFPRNVKYEELPSQEKDSVDTIMESLRPEIESKAKELLFYETRDRIVKCGDLLRLLKEVKGKRKVSLKRKKGCIYIQFGTGEPSDPIEEYLVAST